jgi:glycosyltransferase involved in cell wall biosynthesis
MPTLVSVFGVDPFRIGGTETFARELSAQLGQLGWKSVLCFQSAPPPEVRSFLDLPNVEVEVVGDTSTSNMAATKALMRVFRRYKPEIVHLHFTGFLGIYPWMAKLISAKKVFFTDHGSRPAGYEPKAAAWWKRKVVRMINWPLTKVVCVSGYGYRCMTAMELLPKDRFELVYNGVDLSRVSRDEDLGRDFKQKWSIPADRTVVVQVSWIIPEKGIPDLLKAARLVVEKEPNVHFVFVGEGAYRDEYMKTAKQFGLQNNVTWTGLVADPFGEGVFQAADIVCQVSQWEEVFGWMIAEGMAHGKPIVATRVGGIPELVSEGKSGFLVARGDAEQIADRIRELAINPPLRQSMGRAGKKRTQEDFELRANVRKLVTVYGLAETPTA